MTQLAVITDLEQQPSIDWSRPVIDGCRISHIGLIRHGTAAGNASVALIIQLPDGSQVWAETTWRLLHAAVKALAATPIAAEEVDPR
jgi:hypothetical protein